MWRIAFIIAGGSGLLILAVCFAVLGFSLMKLDGIIFLAVWCAVIYIVFRLLKGGKKNKHKNQVKAMKVVQEVKAPKKINKIYVASSWRNEHYTEVVERLREAEFNVYDFRNPPSGDPGFKWSNIDPEYMQWTVHRYRYMLTHPLAERQFKNDIKAMESCDACVIVLPCGRSAHTEAGWFAGRGKRVIAYIPEKQEPELMYKLFDGVCCSIEEIIAALNG